MRQKAVIKRESPIDNQVHEMTMEIDPTDYQRWMRGEGLIQECFPYLSAKEREFILTGITPDQWTKLFKDD